MASKNRLALVTGAARGIGRATCLHLASLGWSVVGLDHHRASTRDLQKQAREKGLAVQLLHLDLSDSAALQKWCRNFTRRKNRPRLLVNNAAISSEADIKGRRGLKDWNRVLAVNLTAPWLLATSLAPAMPRGSAIVNIASTRALMSEPRTEPYSASKGGLLALTHALAASWQGRLRVNAISPGWIDTSAWQGPGSRRARLRPSDHRQHPAGRVGRPEDIAQAVAWLADADHSGFVTGENLVIDGGMTRKMIYQ